MKQEILEHINTLLAEKVMGFKRGVGASGLFEEEGWMKNEGKDDYIFVRLFEPTTNHNDAYMIIKQLTNDKGLIQNEKLVKELDYFDLSFEGVLWECEFAIP
ncbi:hypothetical protein [Bacillus sp. NPDC094106]|uniref:hypothetical protein n=1 Tax=Bacillus sp. NPDC094106 TaxID=3363949 RepID=UPI0038058D6A